MRFLRKELLLILLILFAILPRFILIDKVPRAINEDELHYVLDAKSFFLTGKDVSGQISPIDIFLFNYPKNEPVQAELQYFLGIPLFGLLGFSMVNLVLPNALIGVLTVVFIYLITLKLFNKKAAIAAGLIASMNPWLIFLSRTTYEAGLATLFFLVFFYVLLTTKAWKILLTIPLALLAFYSYIGTKLIFLPFMTISILYAYLFLNKKKYLKQYLLVFVFSCLLVLFFMLQLRQYGAASRTSEIILPNSTVIKEQVDGLRELAISNPLLNIFDNKFTIYGSALLKNTLNVFSASYLFANADYFFMQGGHGFFYSIDLFFLIIGLGWLFIKHRRLFLLFIIIIFISAMPQILPNSHGSENFAPHISLVIPFFIILMGLGLSVFLKTFKVKKYTQALTISIVVIYLILFASFMHFYFFKFPVQDGNFSGKNRLLAKYISLYEDKTPITVLSANPKLTYKEYLFYRNIYNKNTLAAVGSALKNDKFVIGNVSFTSCGLEVLNSGNGVVIIDAICGKQLNKKSVNIVQVKDGGTRYFIYDDKACNNYELQDFIIGLKLSDFDIEKLSQKDFCETYITSF